MNKNNFEKQVSQQLNNLKIEPGENSWLVIEKRLEQEKKRRRGIFFFFLLFALIIGAGGIFWITTIDSHSPQIAKSPNKKIEETNHEYRDTTSTKSDSKNQAAQILVEKKQEKKSLKFHIPGKRETLEPKPNENVQEIIVTKSGDRNTIPKESNEKSVLENPADEKSAIDKKIEVISDENRDLLISIPDSTSSQDISPEKKSEIKSSGNLTTKNNEEKPVIKNPFSKKWRIGLHAGAGAFHMGNSLFDMDKTNVSSDYNNSVQSQVSWPNQLKMRNQVTFNVGIDLEKNLSAKSIINIGAEYQLYSYSLSASDSVAFYYSIHRQNSLHYLNIPISINFALNANKKIPLYWRSGLKLGYLLKANTGQFNNSGFDFPHEPVFKKFSIGIFTGVNAQVLSNEKINLRVGPYILYNATKLAGKGIYGNKHLTTIGIRSEIFFSKKKKR